MNSFIQSDQLAPSQQACLLFAHIRCTRGRLCMNPVRSLLSMRCRLLRYSFESRPNRRLFATTGSVMTIGLSLNGYSNILHLFFLPPPAPT